MNNLCQLAEPWDQAFALGLGRTNRDVNVIAGDLSEVPVLHVVRLDLDTHRVGGHPRVGDGLGRVVSVTPPANSLLSISK